MKNQTLKITYYELENTINEWHSTINYRGTHLPTVKEKMKNYSNWWCSNGTGTIYQVDIYENCNSDVIIKRKKIYEK